MQFTTFVPLAALLSLQISFVFAAPVEVEPVEASFDLEKRAGTGTQADPFILDIPCQDWEEVCEAQCIAILCFGAPQVLQYGGAGSSSAQRTAAGASSSPFSGSMASLGGGNKVATPDPAWTSPEDTTNACSTQGGIGTLIAPVLAKHNTTLMGGKAASSVCSASAPASDQINYMYRRTSKKEGNSFIWQHVKYPNDKWAKNFPGY
ncbi:hypothetical protein ACMFMF_011820 [Clarireedia jacksonii]